jgi:hypothetical protein
MQVDAGRLHRGVTGLGLDRLQCHPGLPQPGQAGMPQLMTGRVGQPSPPTRPVEDLVQAYADSGWPRRRPLSTTNNASLLVSGRSSVR